MTFSKLEEFGDFVISGISGTRLSAQDRSILETVRPCGVLFLKRNIVQDAPYEEWQREFAALVSDIKKACGREKMLFSIDHEGGKVQRTPPPITNFGAPEEYGSKARQVARAMAEELKSLGINLSWAPLADINSNPENPIIGKLKRAFSDDPKEVARIAVEFADEMQKNGIITCGKHFPGHGATRADSHLELPVVDVDEKTLRERELVPFKALIDRNIPSIMTAHVLFKNIDPSNPATFSRKMLTDILRNELGYKGVIIADDINMLAIYDRIRTVEGVSDSVNAGVDTFIVGRFPDPEKDSSPIVLAELLMKACVEKRISAERLNESKSRVSALLAGCKMHDPHLIGQQVFARHQELVTAPTATA